MTATATHYELYKWRPAGAAGRLHRHPRESERPNQARMTFLARSS
jgi:hypothetical protein